MRLSLLRAIDLRLGAVLLYVFALPVRLLSALFPAPENQQTRHVFLKLKGGGSLIIALPALLGLRRRFPDAEFLLVCTEDAKIYAELTGIFDRYLVINDASFFALIRSGIKALRDCFRPSLCVDLEPNSLLAALFTLLTCARRRVGLVKAEQPARALAYTDAIAFNAVAPVYPYYDQICTLLTGTPLSAEDARRQVQGLLPSLQLAKVDRKTVGLVAFTSDFARERMMPTGTWLSLLRQSYGSVPLRFFIFGSPRNRQMAANLCDALRKIFPEALIENRAGTGSLAEAASELGVCDEIWAIDSGLLHLARLLGIPTRSFWGPTMPSQRLRPVEGLKEQTFYQKFLCSPCIQASIVPPCGGQNLCMITMAETNPNRCPSWVKHL